MLNRTWQRDFEVKLGRYMVNNIVDFLLPNVKEVEKKFENMIQEIDLGRIDEKIRILEKEISVLRRSDISFHGEKTLYKEIEMLVLDVERKKACGCWYCYPQKHMRLKRVRYPRSI